MVSYDRLSLLFTLSWLAILCLAGCSREQQFQRQLPAGVTDVKMVDQIHCTFKWRGREYLFGWTGHSRYIVPLDTLRQGER